MYNVLCIYVCICLSIYICRTIIYLLVAWGISKESFVKSSDNWVLANFARFTRIIYICSTTHIYISIHYVNNVSTRRLLLCVWMQQNGCSIPNCSGECYWISRQAWKHVNATSRVVSVYYTVVYLLPGWDTSVNSGVDRIWRSRRRKGSIP